MRVPLHYDADDQCWIWLGWITSRTSSFWDGMLSHLVCCYRVVTTLLGEPVWTTDTQDMQKGISAGPSPKVTDPYNLDRAHSCSLLAVSMKWTRLSFATDMVGSLGERMGRSRYIPCCCWTLRWVWMMGKLKGIPKACALSSSSPISLHGVTACFLKGVTQFESYWITKGWLNNLESAC